MKDEFIIILFYLILGEVCILLILVVSIVIHRLIMNHAITRDSLREEGLNSYYLNLIEKKHTFDLKNYPGKESWFKSELVVLEAFRDRLEGDEWSQMRNRAVESLLILRARKWANSRLWTRRNFAARVFRLHAEPEDEPFLLELMVDKKFLIRSPASFALIDLESKEGVIKILQAIQKEPGYAQFLYRDALLRGSEKVLEILNEVAKDPSLHLQVLDVLGAKSWGGTISFLAEDLKSEDPVRYHLALKVLIRNPLPDSFSYFQAALSNPDPKVRVIAMKGISLFPSDELSNILENGLRDFAWEVRVEAGKALKGLGEAGLNILNKQEEEVSKEAAQFVIEFG